MFMASVYSRIMQMETKSSSPLLQRIGRLFRAKQFLVFYAIGLYVVTYVPPLLTGWLRDHRPLGELLDEGEAVFADLWSAPGLAIAVVVVAYLALSAWFWAGYLRSLTGDLTWRPASGRQFGRLLGLTIVYELLAGGLSFALDAIGFRDAEPGTRDALLGELTFVAYLVLWTLLLYVAYAIVVSDVSLWVGFRRSLSTLRANLLISVLMVLTPVVVGMLSASLTGDLDGGAARLLPTMVIDVVVWGVVGFVADVVLVSVYVDTLERPAPHRRTDDAR